MRAHGLSRRQMENRRIEMEQTGSLLLISGHQEYGFAAKTLARMYAEAIAEYDAEQEKRKRERALWRARQQSAEETP